MFPWRLLLVLAGSLVAAYAAEKEIAQAGWAEVDITPPLGIALGGRGGPDTAANKILDRLSAQVLILKDARGNGFVLASFDLVGLPHELSDQIRNDIVGELSVPWNLIVLNASHTHSGPYMLRSLMAGVGPSPQIESDYFATLREKVLQATRAAARSLQPADVAVFETKSDVAINRRGKNGQGKRGIIPDPDGPIDDRVWILKISPRRGGDPALVFSYACHPVLVYGYDYAAISADFPGATRHKLREELGPKTHVQFVQGFAGNVRPRIVADAQGHRFRKSRPEDVEQVARQLSGAIRAALKTSGEPLQLNIAGCGDRPFLPRGEPPPRSVYEQLLSQSQTGSNVFLAGVSRYWLQRYDRGEGFAGGDAWSLGLIRLADNQWVVHSAGEPCVEWRNKIAEWLSPLKVVTWGYCQEARSYLPTESMLPEGGYEVLESNRARASTPAPYAAGIEAAMQRSLSQQAAFLGAPIRPRQK